MYIKRDIENRLVKSLVLAQIVLGPRQCGKSTLLSYLAGNSFQEVTFDDLRLRNLANSDPALFLEQFSPPILLDEVQYVPNLFSEIKLRVDKLKQAQVHGNVANKVLFRMTGSNQWLLDKNVKESLVGRASYFYLNTLSVHEILRALPKTSIQEIMLQGGWPELYTNDALAVVQYLNDYIRSYIEKDIVLSAGVQKQNEFNLVLGLLAARTGMLLDYNNVAKNSGVRSVTVKEWASLLERASLVYCLRPYASNLNKRLTKTPKIYFLDTGLAARLQGWQDAKPLMLSPQAGALFETLVCAEIFKFIQNYGKDWQFYLWRTKDGEEIDFLLVTNSGKIIALDAKMSVQNVRPVSIPSSFRKMFPDTKQIVLVTFAGQRLQLSEECSTVPIAKLHDFLVELDP